MNDCPGNLVRKILAKQLCGRPEDLHDDALLSDLGMDSLDRVAIGVAIEEEIFEELFELPEATMKMWRTVGDVVASVNAEIDRRREVYRPKLVGMRR
jgi:acyl carrier protein